MRSVKNQTFLITGATDGLGKAVSLDLAGQGATLLLHGRDPAKGADVLEQVRRLTGNEKGFYYNADLSSLQEVRSLAREITEKHDRLDVLINNAGIGGARKRELNADGYELCFTVNYLSAFLLTKHLLPLLKDTAPSRIVNVVSGAQEPLHLDDLMMEQHYSSSRAYAQSKLALVMFTFDLAEELKETGVKANCLHPASMMDTKLVREVGGRPLTSVEQGVDTVKYAAISSETADITGAFFDYRRPVRANAQAYDEQVRAKLRETTEELIAG